MDEVVHDVLIADGFADHLTVVEVTDHYSHLVSPGNIV
jgi:hypothetical protein